MPRQLGVAVFPPLSVNTGFFHEKSSKSAFSLVLKPYCMNILIFADSDIMHFDKNCSQNWFLVDQML